MTLAQILADVETRTQLPVSKREELLYAVARMKGWSRTDLLLHLRCPLGSNDVIRFEAIAQGLAHGVPVEYILGHAEFGDISVMVQEGVFVPRPETEELVEQVAGFISRECQHHVIGLDVCSGSGAIALALANRFSELSVTGLDIDATSVCCARQTAEYLGFAQRVCFIQTNVLSNQSWKGLAGKIDFIVSNPPYVQGDRFEAAHDSSPVEPRKALYGGWSGLVFYRRIIAEARKVLRPGGLLLFEIDDGLEVAILDLFSRYGMSEGRWLPDLRGLPRYAEARQAR